MSQHSLHSGAKLASKSARSKLSKLPPAPAPREDVLSFEVPGGNFVEEATVRTDQARMLRTLEGPGRYRFTDGTLYEGTFLNSEVTGTGKIFFPNGDVYCGDLLRGFRHGHGVFLTADACVRYEGLWHRGQRHGRGQVLYGTGLTLELNLSDPPASATPAVVAVVYTGEFKQNKKHGQGVLVFHEQSGSGYEGEWREHAMEGSHGEFLWKQRRLDAEGEAVELVSERYLGEWRAGKAWGLGRYEYVGESLQRDHASLQRDFNAYEGEFVGGFRDGEGVFSYADGSLYKGKYVANKKHGKDGVYIAYDGQEYTGEFFGDFFAKNIPYLLPSNPISPMLDLADLEADQLVLGQVVQGGAVRDAVNYALTKLSLIKAIYKRYNHVNTVSDLWCLARDAGVLAPTFNLATLNRTIVQGERNFRELRRQQDTSRVVDIHDPARNLLFRHFLESLFRIAHVRYAFSGESLVARLEIFLSALAQLRPFNFSGEVFASHDEVVLGGLLSALFTSSSLAPHRDCTVTISALLDALRSRGLLDADDSQLLQASGNLFEAEVGFGDAPEHLVSSLTAMTAKVDLQSVVGKPASLAAPRASVVGLDAIAIGAVDGLLLLEPPANASGASDADEDADDAGMDDGQDARGLGDGLGDFKVSTFELLKMLAETFSPAHVTKVKTQGGALAAEDVTLAEFLQSEITKAEVVRLMYRVAETKSGESNGKLPVSQALAVLANKLT